MFVLLYNEEENACVDERVKPGMYILQVNFRVTVPRHVYEEESFPVAEAIAGVRGLLWKAWGYNEEAGTACGFYLFEDEDALDCYLRSSIVKGLKSSPAFGDITVNRFELLGELSKITRCRECLAVPAGEVAAVEKHD